VPRWASDSIEVCPYGFDVGLELNPFPRAAGSQVVLPCEGSYSAFCDNEA
jgi:hypothetical protein